MKKFISVLLSCSLICSNAMRSEAKNNETPPQMSTNSTAKESKNKKLKNGLISGGTIGAAGIAALATILGIKKEHDKKLSLQEAERLSWEEEEKQEQAQRMKEEEKERAVQFLADHRMLGPITRVYNDQVMEPIPSHAVLDGKEFREYLSKFPDAPILFRGVNFRDKSKIDTYMSGFGLCGSYISSTGKATGANIYGGGEHAVYFSKSVNCAFVFAVNSRERDTNGAYIVLASLAKHKSEVAWQGEGCKHICAAKPSENGDFILCTEFFKPTKNIRTLIGLKYFADYDFVVPELGGEDYEDLSGIRDIQIWLLRLGIVLQKVGTDFEGKFDPDRADALLAKLESAELASQ